MGEECKQLRNEGTALRKRSPIGSIAPSEARSKPRLCAASAGLALSPPQAPAKLGSSGHGSVLALSGRLTASSSPKVGALGKGVKSERNA